MTDESLDEISPIFRIMDRIEIDGKRK